MKDFLNTVYNSFNRRDAILGFLVGVCLGGHPFVALLGVFLVAAGREGYNYLYNKFRPGSNREVSLLDALDIIAGGLFGVILIMVVELVLRSII